MEKGMKAMCWDVLTIHELESRGIQHPHSKQEQKSQKHIWLPPPKVVPVARLPLAQFSHSVATPGWQTPRNSCASKKWSEFRYSTNALWSTATIKCDFRFTAKPETWDGDNNYATVFDCFHNAVKHPVVCASTKHQFLNSASLRIRLDTVPKKDMLSSIVMSNLLHWSSGCLLTSCSFAELPADPRTILKTSENKVGRWQREILLNCST